MENNLLAQKCLGQAIGFVNKDKLENLKNNMLGDNYQSDKANTDEY